MEGGRALIWVAGDEALIASRRRPAARFATIEPSKEAHDSNVPAAQVPTHEASAAPRARLGAWPRGPPLPSPRDCFGPRETDRPRNDGRGFLSIVTSEDVSGSQ